MRVRTPSWALCAYPDVIVVCDEPQFEDRETDTLLKPTVLVEVLSDGFEGYDWGQKFRLSRSVLVAHDEPYVERYCRLLDGQWELSEAHGLDAELTLEAIGCTLPLAEIYDCVEFPEEAPPSPDEGVFTD